MATEEPSRVEEIRRNGNKEMTGDESGGNSDKGRNVLWSFFLLASNCDLGEILKSLFEHMPIY